jgi:hypothetical protein
LLNVVACSPSVSRFVHPWHKRRFAYADSDFCQRYRFVSRPFPICRRNPGFALSMDRDLSPAFGGRISSKLRASI